MKLKILFEKEKIDERFSSGWGISYLVGENVLFDTGEKFEYLENNARLMNVDLSKIDKVVISHTHWDHIAGLWELLNRNKGITVYGCARFGEDFKNKVTAACSQFVEVKEMTELEKGIYASGELMANYKGEAVAEHAMALNSGSNIAILCGCCHPGALNTLQKIAGFFGRHADMLVGGLHLMDKEKRFAEYIMRELPVLVKKIAPGHCTGSEAIALLKDIYKENFIELKVGMELEI